MTRKTKHIILWIIICLLMLSFIAGHTVTKKYTIFFDSNEGSICQPMQIKGKQVIVLPVTEKDGYTFDGWYFDKDIWENELTSATFSKTRPKSDMTVYAKWIFTGYTITFETNGGSLVESIKLNSDQTISSQPFTEREGYDFLGWCIDSSLIIYYEFGSPVEKSMTLYAKWMSKENKQHYTISFQTNGANSISPIQVLEGQAITLPQTNRVGYDFMGWYIDSDFTMLYPNNAVVTASFTLYAKWQRNPNMLEIIFDSDGGSAIETKWLEKGQTIEMPQPQKDGGYTFIGWYRDEQRTQLYDFSNGFYESMTLFAKWQEILPETVYYTVYYYSEGEVVWQFDLEQNTMIQNMSIEKDSGDYIFEGWYVSSDLVEPYDFNNPITEDTYLYAKWRENPQYAENGFIYNLASTEDYYIITDYDGMQTDIVIPKSYDNKPIKKIADNVFKNSIITSITFSEQLTEIGISAFENCHQLLEITTPDTLEEISDRAFAGCNNLLSINVEGSPNLGRYVYSGCAALRNINLSNDITKISDYMFQNCYALQAITLPLFCQEIGISAFSGCRSLYEVNIDQNLTTISNQAFYDCNSLSEIDLKNTTTIKEKVFSKSGLIEIQIPNSVKSIGYSAFGECNRLETISIGSGLEQMAMSFLSSNNIKNITVSEFNNYYKDINNNMYNKEGTVLIFYAAGQNDTEFIVPSGVQTIESFAFYAAINLTKITIPSTVNEVMDLAFMELLSLTEIEVSNDNMSLMSNDGVLYSKQQTKLISYPINKSQTEYVMDTSVTEIAPYAFMNNKNLQQIILSENIARIPEYAFYNATNLSQIDISQTQITEIGEYAFYDCRNLSNFQLTLNVTSIGSYAFAKSQITDFIILSNVTEIGASVFEDCTHLERVRIGAGIDRIENSVFNNCVSLTEVDIYGAPEYIGDAFNQCHSLEKVTIRDIVRITDIADYAFGISVELYVKSEVYSQYYELYSAMFTSINVVV